MEHAFVVFDVGKTNKKLLVYDGSLQLVTSTYDSFPTQWVDGVEVEPLEEINRWFLANLANFAARYPVRAVSVTTHGACFVCVDEFGSLSVPVVSYTHEPADGEDLHRAFFDLVGEPNTLQEETATVELKPLVNPGKLLFFLQRQYPEAFARTKRILFYPQYFAYLLTGEVVADYTYVGCHTYLWDFRNRDWSHVARTLGLTDVLPERIVPPWEPVGRVKADLAHELGLAPDTCVAAGIHDSNASILPYLLEETGDFVLNSTGTWCVAMHPAQEVRFEEGEIGKSVFFNQSAFGMPIKTSILSGGLEFETYSELIGGDHVETEVDPDLYTRIVSEKRHFILPSVLKGAGQFPSSVPRLIDDGTVYYLEDIRSGAARPALLDDPTTAYAVLNLSLAIQTRIALERVGLRDGEKIYVEGGFRNNEAYKALLAGFFPSSETALTTLEQATSFGAAIVAKAARTGDAVESLADTFDITPRPVEPLIIKGMADYVTAFMQSLER